MDNQAQICGDGPLLLWYAAGALGDEESAQVARHVEDCPGCQTLVRQNRELAQTYLSLSRPEARHLAADVLVGLASGEEGAGPTEARAHLAACDECRQIVSTLEKVERDEQDSSWILETLGARLRSTWAGITRGAWMRSPLPAYLLALVLLYPAYLGLVGRSDDVAPRLLPPPVPVASETERGSGESPVQVEANGASTVLTFFVPIAPDRYRYQLELRTKDGRRLFFSRDAKSFDGVGTFALTVPGRSLRTGSYELRVEEREREAGELANVYLFPFSVGQP
jgi:hypothetical protein